MKEPFVSVVVPMYNSQETIESCLDSLINLDYPKDRYEIIIVDDHSTDESVDIVKSFAYANGNIRLLRQVKGKKGPAAARNLGIKRSKGEFIASTVSDEMMFSNWLNELLPSFSNNKTAAVGALLIEKHPLDKGLSPKIQSIIINPADKPSTVAAGNVIYRKEILHEMNGFNEFCVFNDLDVDLHYRMQEKGFELIAVQKYLGQHKQRHSIKAFYNRLKGFGAAGIIMSFFNFKEASKSKFKNQRGILQYFVLFAALIAYIAFLAIILFIDPKIALSALIGALGFLGIISLIWAFVRIKQTNSNILHLPLTAFYIFVKLIAIIHGVFYGLFYYLQRKK